MSYTTVRLLVDSARLCATRGSMVKVSHRDARAMIRARQAVAVDDEGGANEQSETLTAEKAVSVSDADVKVEHARAEISAPIPEIETHAGNENNPRADAKKRGRPPGGGKKKRSR